MIILLVIIIVYYIAKLVTGNGFILQINIISLTSKVVKAGWPLLVRSHGYK